MKKELVQIMCCLLLTLKPALAQTFLYEAKLEPVPTDGFYKISLNPQVMGKLKPDLSDIRLYEGSSQEIPYILQQEEPVQYKKLFKEYEILSKISQPKSGTSLILRNAGRSKINNISLEIQNTNATKKAQLSGSNDARHWYTIDDGFVLQPVKSQSATSEVKSLEFPLSEYEYYKLDIADSLSAPINIIKAGYYDTHPETGKYTFIEGLQAVQKDSSSLKQTFVYVQSENPVAIDKLVIEVGSPAYYRRKVEVKTVYTTKDRRKREKTTYETVGYATINSSEDNVILPEHFHAQDFYLLIYNGDNSPLQIRNVKAYQLNTYLIASLKKGQTYQLKFGHTALYSPMYDLAYFKDKLPATIPVIQPKGIKSLANQSAITDSGTFFFNRKILIWAAIGLVVALLSYLSFRMIKDMKGSE